VSGATSASLAYDGDGNRVLRQDPTGLTVNVGAVEVEISGAQRLTTTYYFVGGQRIAMRKAGVVYYLHGDHLGSASLATDAGGAKMSEMRYTPFGETRFGDAPTDRRFTGQREEAGIGLYDYGARFYLVSVGRFVSSDTIIPDLAKPQSLNRYSYVNNNPLKYIDPTGHEGGDGGFPAGNSSDPIIQLEREQEENERFIIYLIQNRRWAERRQFLDFMRKIRPGSIGIFKWSGRFPQPGDVGHAVIGVDDGVFIGTAGSDSDFGVFMTSAAEIYRNEPWLQQLSIYEVQDLDKKERAYAAKFAIDEYSAGYSYLGAWTNDRKESENKKWYCSELVVAALERGGVTFYEMNTGAFLYGQVTTVGLPCQVPYYYTIVGDTSTSKARTPWSKSVPLPLLQTWP